MVTQEPALYAILPWFGSKRTMAPIIVEQLGPHSYYFEACAGSMAVLFAKEPAHHETACDLHGGLTNLGWMLQDESTAVKLYSRLQRVLYCDELYMASREWLEKTPDPQIGLDWAYHYFIASWMGRNGVSGTARVNYSIATRWTAGGGSGPLRFRNAVGSIPAWHDRLRNVHIMRRDVFDVLPSIEDQAGVSIYADPPYFRETRTAREGSRTASYVHEFTDAQHVQLANHLRRFAKARVVVSYYADPRLAELYPGWTFLDCKRQKHLAVQNKRGMGRTEAPEVLIMNGPLLDPQRESSLF